MACSTAVLPSWRAKGPGLQSLPREVLQKILALVREAAVDERGSPLEDEGWREGFLVPLRPMCRSFRDVVDAGLTARTLRVEPKSPRDACILLRVTNWLHASPRAWPHLTSLRLHLDWPADYLHFALLTLAGHCSFLTRLHLNTAIRQNSDDNAPGHLDIGVLHNLPNLSALSLHGFSRYPSWACGLERLTSVKELDLVDSGLLHFDSWPELVSLSIDGVKSSGLNFGKFHLLLQRGLRHLSISHLALEDLEVPRTVETLELRGVAIDGWDYEDYLPDLTSLKVRDMNFSCIEDMMGFMSQLRTLQVDNVDLQVGNREAPSLAHLEKLTSLVWTGNHAYEDTIPLPQGISDLTALQELVLSASNSPLMPPLDALSCLQKLSISNMYEISDWPELTALTGLTELTLSRNHPTAGIPDDLSALVTLEKLFIEYYEFMDVNVLRPLSRLKTLTLLECEEATKLPDLKPLSSLETLHLSGMNYLRVAPHLPSCVTSLVIAHCPVLRRLPILMPGMPLCKLTLQALPEVLVSQVTAIASLQELTIRRCPDLLTLPSLQSLRMLQSIEVSSCPLLRSIDCRRLTMLRRFNVSDCEMLERVEVGLSGKVTCTITGCPQLQFFYD